MKMKNTLIQSLFAIFMIVAIISIGFANIVNVTFANSNEDVANATILDESHAKNHFSHNISNYVDKSPYHTFDIRKKIWERKTLHKPTNANITNLTTNLSTEIAKSTSPDRSKIAFSRFDNIWVMNPDGGNKVQLTAYSGQYGASSATWSPDGNKIAFERYNYEDMTDWNIWVMNSDGSNKHRITSGGVCWDPAWGPAKIPALLVHGYYGKSEHLTEMKSWLENDNFTVYIVNYTHGEVANGDIKKYANALDSEIERIKKETGAKKVDIVAHSMGGLVSRY